MHIELFTLLALATEWWFFMFFAKKTQATSVRDIEIAKKRFKELMGGKDDKDR